MRISVAIAFCALFVLAGNGPANAQSQAWGWNGWGQLGQGAAIGFFPVPVPYPGADDTVGVAGGWANSFFVRSDGSMIASGYNNFGSVGDGTLTQRNTAVPVLNVSNIKQASGGTAHAGALRTDGQVYMWGSHQNGQLGIGGLGGNFPSPVLIGLTDVVQLELGDQFTLALKSDGTVWSWGNNAAGQLGDGSNLTRSNPVRVGLTTAGFTNIVAISAGADFGMALKADGSVWLWGSNAFGQLGGGLAGGTSLSPTANPTLTGITQISAGQLHAMALRSDGSVWTWGFNRDGQAANGTSGGNQTTPIPRLSSSQVVAIKAGGYFNLVLRRDGSVWGWGRNFSGSLGAGFRSTNACTCEVAPVVALVGTGNLQIAAGVDHGVAIKPTFVTAAGSGVVIDHQTFRITFVNVTASGQTSISTVDPETFALTLPPNYVLDPNSPAYEIGSTATTTGNIEVCFKVSEPNPVRFASLRVLHGEGANFVDRTVPQTPDSYMKQRVCANVTSFSPFAIATGFSPTNATATVSGRVMSANGLAIAGARISATDSSGNTATVTSNSFGNYRLEELRSGETYLVSVRRKGTAFEPRSQVVYVGENITDLDFVVLIGDRRSR